MAAALAWGVWAAASGRRRGAPHRRQQATHNASSVESTPRQRHDNQNDGVNNDENDDDDVDVEDEVDAHRGLAEAVPCADDLSVSSLPLVVSALAAHGRALLLAGLLAVAAWIYVQADGTFANAELVPDAAAVGEDSRLLALLSFAPVLLGGIAAITGVALLLLVSAARARAASPNADADPAASLGLRLVASFAIVGCGATWVAASLAGGASPLANVATTFIGMMALTLSVVLLAAFGTERLIRRLNDMALVRQLHAKLHADSVLRGLLLLLVGPLLPPYALLSAVNNAVRTRTCGYPAVLTPVVSRQFATIRSWHATEVCRWVLLWHVLYFSVAVLGGKLTPVLLATILPVLATLPLALVCLAFGGLGALMFLAPPVPGVAVYLAGGALVAGRAMEPDVGASFAVAVLLAIGVNWAIKLVSVLMQQVLIGEQLSHVVAVRAAVGVNSAPIRAARLLLAVPGLSYGKVVLLCGLPDWPITTLTGILGLPRLSMIVGTLPVVGLVAPSSLAGAAQVTGDASLASTTLAIAGLSQLIIMMAATKVVADTVEGRADDLAQLPVDEEVAAATARDALRDRAKLQRLRWHRLPSVLRFLLALATVTSVCSQYLLLFAGSACFRSVEVTDDLDAVLGGSIVRLARTPWGQTTTLVACLAVVALVALSAYGAVARVAQEDLQAAQEEEERVQRSVAGTAELDEVGGEVVVSEAGDDGEEVLGEGAVVTVAREADD